MAEFVKTLVPFSATSAALTFTPATGTDSIALDNADGRLTLIIRNQNAQNATVTLKAGDGALSPLGDVAVSVAASQTAAVPFARVGSARVKQTAGTNRGTVSVVTAVDSGGSLASVGIAVLSVE